MRGVKGERGKDWLGPSVTLGPFHFSLFTFFPCPFALNHPLPGAVRCNLCSVAASAHAAPAPPVILGGIVEKNVAALVRAFSDQGRIPITEEVGCGLGKRR